MNFKEDQENIDNKDKALKKKWVKPQLITGSEIGFFRIGPPGDGSEDGDS
jgi:hypothetical protein